jgi:nitrite reductase (NO-forming)
VERYELPSVDLHAVLRPGGGMGVSEAKQGESRTFTFKAMLPGVYGPRKNPESPTAIAHDPSVLPVFSSV